jgi:two-component system sensor histidine kinase KdpD
MNPTTNRAQDFLDLLERAKHGRLKIYLGFAAGVGKTVRMLKEAQALKLRGVDVVLAFIETHGRAETADLIGDLEVVPRKQFAYRGITVEEMDLDAVLARRPEIAIVDEVAHTNVPLCRNRKRYQDILAITQAGINVICAFNIQHLESLNDLIERVTGVVVRETIPDTFVKEADQVVTVDLSVDDLMERLKSGKIYAQDKIPWALEHFFRIANLSTLRELVLLEVAESLGRRQPSGPEELALLDQTSPRVLGRVMVCMASASPRAKTLLRKPQEKPPPTSMLRPNATFWKTFKRPGNWAPRSFASRPGTRFRPSSTLLGPTAWATLSSAAPIKPGGGKSWGVP